MTLYEAQKSATFMYTRKNTAKRTSAAESRWVNSHSDRIVTGAYPSKVMRKRMPLRTVTMEGELSVFLRYHSDN